MSKPLISDEEIGGVLEWAALEYQDEGDTEAYEGRTEEAIRALLALQRKRLAEMLRARRPARLIMHEAARLIEESD